VGWSRPWSAAGCGICPCSSCCPATRGGAWAGAARAGAGLRRVRGRRCAAPGPRSTRVPGPLRDGRDGAALADLPPGGGCRRGGAAQGAGRARRAGAGVAVPSRRREKLTAEVFGHDRAGDLAHWRSDASAAVAIERGGDVAGLRLPAGGADRAGGGARRDDAPPAVAAAAAADAGGGGNVTVRVPGACASLLEALVGCGFRSASSRSSSPRGRSAGPSSTSPRGPSSIKSHGDNGPILVTGAPVNSARSGEP
jgi:hypothetical protein